LASAVSATPTKRASRRSSGVTSRRAVPRKSSMTQSAPSVSSRMLSLVSAYRLLVRSAVSVQR
jgi:hypothetical protein